MVARTPSAIRLSAPDAQDLWNGLVAAYRRLTPIARVRVVLYVLTALNFAKICRVVPIQRLFDGNPLIAYHYSQIHSDIVSDRRFSKISHRSWGYDPYIGAGQPTGAGLVEVSRAPILLDRLLRRWFDASTSIEVFVWLALMLGPWIVFGAARLWGYDEKAIGVAVTLAAIGSMGHEVLSRLLIYRGNVAFWLAAQVAVFNAGAFFAAFRRNQRAAAIAHALTVPLLVLLDPAVALFQLVPIAAIAAGLPRRALKRALGWSALGLVLAVGLNAFWLSPWLLFERFAPQAAEWEAPGIGGFVGTFYPLGSVWAAIRAFVLIVGATEIYFGWRGGRREERTMAVWATALFFFGLFGAHVPWLRRFEPTRFLFLFMALLTLPASEFMADLFLKPGTLRKAAFLWVLWFGASWQAHAYSYDPPPIRDWFTPRETRLLSDLRRVPRGRRILVEHRDDLNDALWRAAASADHDFVGFSSTWWNTTFSESALFSQREAVELFGKPLKDYDTPGLRQVLERYNVGTLIVTTKATNELMKAHASLLRLRPISKSVDNRIYEVLTPDNGYVLSAAGRARFGPDHIHVRAGEGAASLLLSFHWIEGLEVDPPSTISARLLEGDPVPFIVVDKPAAVREFDIRYRPRGLF